MSEENTWLLGERESWRNKKTFILSALGACVGLGNLWRFPYLVFSHGGGAFIISFFLVLCLVGLPLVFLELSLGQKLQVGAVHAFRGIDRRWWGLGWLMVAAVFLVSIYYVTLMGWSVRYFGHSFQDPLPWQNNRSSEFFYDEVLEIGEIGSFGGINWINLGASAFVWLVCYFSLRKGVLTAGWVVWFTVPVPLLMLLVFFFYGFTLEGSAAGLRFFLAPEFEELLDLEIWSQAVSQVFFSLSLGVGTMVALGSYHTGHHHRSSRGSPDDDDHHHHHHHHLRRSSTVSSGRQDSEDVEEIHEHSAAVSSPGTPVSSQSSPSSSSSPDPGSLPATGDAVPHAVPPSPSQGGGVRGIIRSFTRSWMDRGGNRRSSSDQGPILELHSSSGSAVPAVRRGSYGGVGALGSGGVSVRPRASEGGDFVQDALIIVGVSSVTSLMAGCVVFSILGNMAHLRGVPIQEVMDQGLGLVFVAVPEAVTWMPGSPQFWSAFFFLMLFLLGIDSCFALIETIMTAAMDTLRMDGDYDDARPGWILRNLRGLICCLGFLCGVIFATDPGFFWMELLDHTVTTFLFIPLGLLECIILGWQYGAEAHLEDLRLIADRPYSRFWAVCWKWLTPALLSVLLVVQTISEITNPLKMLGGEVYPTWSRMIVFSMILVPYLGLSITGYREHRRLTRSGLRTKGALVHGGDAGAAFYYQAGYPVDEEYEYDAAVGEYDY